MREMWAIRTICNLCTHSMDVKDGRLEASSRQALDTRVLILKMLAPHHTPLLPSSNSSACDSFAHHFAPIDRRRYGSLWAR
jgi:hypothetical protein